MADSFPAFLDSAGNLPFFLWVGFHEPHRPYRGSTPRPHPPARVMVLPHLADSPETRAERALYCDAIARMGAEIGPTLAEVDHRKLRDNTLVVFLSDNGPPSGGTGRRRPPHCLSIFFLTIAVPKRNENTAGENRGRKASGPRLLRDASGRTTTQPPTSCGALMN